MVSNQPCSSWGSRHGEKSPTISDSSATLESYAYLGLDTLVARNHPQDGVNLSYVGTGTGDGGDRFQFGQAGLGHCAIFLIRLSRFDLLIRSMSVRDMEVRRI